MHRFLTVKWNKIRVSLPVLILFLTLSPSLLLFSESKLEEKSPFLPPGHGAKPAEPEKPQVQTQGPISREIEFRGIAEIGGVYQFSVFNKKDQKGYWLTEDKSEDGISVSNFDEDASTIVIMMNGRSERLTLASATEAPMPVAQSKPPSQPQTRPAVLPPQLQNNNSDNTNRKVVPRRRVILPKKTN